MKTTNSKLINEIYPSLMAFSQLKSTLKGSYACARSLKKIEEPISVYNSEKKKIIEQDCLKNEDGTPKTTPILDDNRKETNFIKYNYESIEKEKEVVLKLNELDNMEIELDLFQVNISDVEGTKELTGQIVLQLMDVFIKE